MLLPICFVQLTVLLIHWGIAGVRLRIDHAQQWLRFFLLGSLFIYLRIHNTLN